MQKITVPFELKEASEDGNFKGWASVFGNADLGSDIIAKDVKVSFKSGQNGRLKLALYHDTTKMAGNASFEVSEKGIFVDGQLNLNVSYVKDAHHLIKDGTLDEMSIGFNLVDFEYIKKDGRDIRVIKAMEVWEASIVPFGMNPEAKITQVKSIRDFEKLLKDNGYSQKEAKTIASKGYAALNRDGSSDDTVMVDSLKELNQTITKIFGEE